MPLRKGHIALMRSKTDDPTRERQKEKQKCAPMKVHEPHEPKRRQKREESTKSQKQRVRVTLRGQREMQKATKVQKKNPDLQQGS